MALLIKAIGEKNARVASVFPKNGKKFSLAELQSFVGGYVERLRLDSGQHMWLNEDGKSMGLPLNVIANILAHEETGIAPEDYIVGDVLIANDAESGEHDEAA